MSILRPVSCDSSAHPITGKTFDLINQQSMSLEQIAEKAGVSYTTLRHWQKRRIEPRLSNIEAVLNTLGYCLQIQEL